MVFHARRQQGKECTDDVKVFSRAIPFDQLGRERDVRVFIARTLEPGEVVQTVAERAAALERKQQAAVKQQGLFVPAEGLGQGSKVRHRLRRAQLAAGPAQHHLCWRP